MSAREDSPEAPVQLHTARFAEYPLCTLTVRIDVLAARLGFTLVSYVEDGLGPAKGFACRLPGGMLMVAEELEHMIEHGMARGPAIEVELLKLHELGVEGALQAVLPPLGLTRADLDWVQSQAVVDEVLPSFLERAAKAR